MKIIRYEDRHGLIRFGVEQAGRMMEAEGDPFGGLTPTARPVEITRLLVPVAPVAILCIGLNYRRHALETGAAIPSYPVLFTKGINTVLPAGDAIELPVHLPSTEVDYECELAVIIGKRAKNVSRADALSYVLGYTCANDVSARDWQKEKGGTQWSRGKSFDTFCPMGPHLVTADEIADPNQLRISTRVNDELMQDSRTSDMIFDVPALIEFLSGSTTLLPGTVILTGTPEGVGMARTPPRWLREGDKVAVEIESIGRLENTVIAERIRR
jgi:2-keto-4-pentenoate hydratase/2-oxohepta-3-ene-1,7-dioic acid hydratase in catechol pathway